MPTHAVTFIPGDGTGPEIARVCRIALEATGVRFDRDVQDAGIDVYAREGTPLPERVLDSPRRDDPAAVGTRQVGEALARIIESGRAA